MNRKTVTAISLGIMSAAIICIIAGVICYFTTTKNAVLIIIGIFMMAMGVFMAIVPIILLLVVFITSLISKKK